MRRGVLTEIQQDCQQHQRPMTMTASSPSNINIPAGSLLLPPRGRSHCSLLKKLCPSSICTYIYVCTYLYFFASLILCLFAHIQVMCQPVTSSADSLVSSEQRSKPFRWRERRLVCVCGCVCVRVCGFVILSCSTQTRILLTMCSIKHKCEC